MGDTRFGKKDKNQNIQVFVRVRPINNVETSRKSTTVIETSSNKDVVVYERLFDKPSKKFTFDRVFGSSSKQVDVYNAVVSPLVEQVLAGYNCTVFAYGQTGTGKTFTMEGLNNDPALHWNSDTTTGMIPRALSHLFDELRLLDGQEYMVRVSFLELYNEELFDLLSPTDDTSKIRLFEDTSKKGAVIIHGLEEVAVHNKSEVYKILEKGSEKRQTAATLMNAHSSRSHTVFSITVHIKENTVEGEELLKTGKLNLVDLAGSENVGRSGAVDRRAREAGSINQSLLTLARVIMALVERTPHIPYRESKLTRLLQESLGGRTKTSIIATVSPASINIEETLSTLDYAHRAKNITNRPEINQKLSKKAVLKEYTEEIERLRRDLLAAREKNGVYLAHDNYNEIQALITSQGKEIEEKLNNIKALEETMQKKEKIFNEMQTQYFTQTNELHKAKSKLNNVTHVLTQTKQQLQTIEYDRDEQKHLVERHLSTEKVLLSQAETLLTVADTATLDTHKLHDTIARKTQVEQKNEALGEQFRNNIAENIKNIEKDLFMYKEELKQFCTSVQREIAAQAISECKNIDMALQQIPVNLTNKLITKTDDLTQSVNFSYSHYENWIEEEVKNAGIMTERECESLSRISRVLVPKIVQNLIENEMTATLRTLYDSLSLKMQYISCYVRDSINAICDYRLEDCDRTCKNVKEIKENLDKLLQHQNQMMEKRRLFAKMMEEVTHQFSLLHESEEENYSVVNSKFIYVNGVCNRINEDVTNSCTVNTNLNKNLEEKIQNVLEEIENNVATETEKNEKLVKLTAEEGNILVNELNSTISASCDGLRQYKSSFECNAKELQQKVKKDKGEILSSINNVHKISVDVGTSNAEYMEKQKVHISNNSAEVVLKLENQNSQSVERTDRIVEELRATQYHVDKFFAEDIQRDIPTGTTPVRKEFSYPRQFVATSPHERILQKFREVRRSVETSEDDDDTFINEDATIKQIANSTALCDITFISSVEEDTVCDTPIPICNSTLKHSSSSNSLDANFQSLKPVSNISKKFVPHRARSESNIYIQNGNKENSYEFVKPANVKGSQRSKLKTPKRQVLGMQN